MYWETFYSRHTAKITLMRHNKIEKTISLKKAQYGKINNVAGSV
jgi:hypothetical protein